MVKVSVSRRKTTIELDGTLEEVLNDALNLVGKLYKAMEKQDNTIATMFLIAIPRALAEYGAPIPVDVSVSREEPTTDAQEDKHENDAL